MMVTITSLPVFIEAVDKKLTTDMTAIPRFIPACHSPVAFARPAIRDTFGAVECRQY